MLEEWKPFREERLKDMKAGEESTKNVESEVKKVTKPPFRPAKDDTKPLLQDPILRSDPIETEEALLRLPPFPPIYKPNNKTH